MGKWRDNKGRGIAPGSQGARFTRGSTDHISTKNSTNNNKRSKNFDERLHRTGTDLSRGQYNSTSTSWEHCSRLQQPRCHVITERSPLLHTPHQRLSTRFDGPDNQQNCPLHVADIDHHHLKDGSLAPRESASQTASRSVLPFLHSSPVRPTHRHTHTQTTLRVTTEATGSIYAVHAMRSKNNNKNSLNTQLVTWIRSQKDHFGPHLTKGISHVTILNLHPLTDPQGGRCSLTSAHQLLYRFHVFVSIKQKVARLRMDSRDTLKTSPCRSSDRPQHCRWLRA